MERARISRIGTPVDGRLQEPSTAWADGGAQVIVPGKVALIAVLGAVALGFIMALALSPAVDDTESNVLIAFSNNIVVTVEPVGNAQ